LAQHQSNTAGVAFALISFAVFASHDAVIKFLGDSYMPFQILFFSVLFSFPLVTLMLMRDREASTLRPVHPRLVAARTIAGAITGAAAFYAFTVLPLAQVYAFLFAAPLLITVLSIPFLGEKVGIHRWSAVALGLVGVMIVLRPGATDISLGHIAALVAAAGSALVAVITRKIGNEERTAVLMLYPMMANFVLMGAAMPFVYQPMPVEHLGLLALMSGLGFLGGVFMISAYRRADAAIVAPMHYSQIIWAALFGFFLFDEVPDLFTWVGAAVIILSGIYVVLRETLSGRSANRPVTRSRSRSETPASPSIAAMLRAQSDRVLPGHEALAKPREAK
jgi:S-adenosylmethionine uptake transporter